MPDLSHRPAPKSSSSSRWIVSRHLSCVRTVSTRTRLVRNQWFLFYGCNWTPKKSPTRASAGHCRRMSRSLVIAKRDCPETFKQLEVSNRSGKSELTFDLWIGERIYTTRNRSDMSTGFLDASTGFSKIYWFLLNLVTNQWLDQRSLHANHVT